MKRVLGIDHGEARIGLALSDELGMLAHPLETIHVAETEPLGRICELVAEKRVETIVLGMPYRMDGTEGPAVRKVRTFRAGLEEKLPSELGFAEIDERLTTVAAQDQLYAAGKSVRNSRNVIDQAAAVVILQDYLDAQQGMAMLPDPEDEEDFS